MNMTRNILFVAIALTAACKKKDGAGGSDCAGAVDHMMQVQMGSMPKDMPEDMKKQMNDMMGKAKAAIVKSCTDTKWSADAITCIKSIKSEDESKKCDEKLTKDQRDAAEKAAAEATGMGGPAMKKDEEPKAPEGSAAGSAEAGSAAAGSAEAGSAAGSAEEKK
jgi:hypothetical protein